MTGPDTWLSAPCVPSRIFSKKKKCVPSRRALPTGTDGGEQDKQKLVLNAPTCWLVPAAVVARPVEAAAVADGDWAVPAGVEAGQCADAARSRQRRDRRGRPECWARRSPPIEEHGLTPREDRASSPAAEGELAPTRPGAAHRRHQRPACSPAAALTHTPWDRRSGKSFQIKKKCAASGCHHGPVEQVCRPTTYWAGLGHPVNFAAWAAFFLGRGFCFLVSLVGFT